MISLCTFVKDEANCIRHMVDSVRAYVQEIIVVDTGSTDGTVDICKDLGARVYKVGFTDFGSIRTLASHLARCPWVLMLDADETLTDPGRLAELTDDRFANAFALPRRRWLDLEMTKQTEVEAWPDVQVRLYRNNLNYFWERELHETFQGSMVRQVNNPIIEHFHDVFKDEARLAERRELYTKLSQQAGVAIEGGHVL